MRAEWVGKRASVRSACVLRSEIRFEDGRKTLDCTITDISPTGARITLPGTDDAPAEFELFIPSRSETKYARVRWQKDDKIGVEFLKGKPEEIPAVTALQKRVSKIEERLSGLAGGELPAPVELPLTATQPADPAAGEPIDALGSRLDSLEARLESVESATSANAAVHRSTLAELAARLAAVESRREIETLRPVLAAPMAAEPDALTIRRLQELEDQVAVLAAPAPVDHSRDALLQALVERVAHVEDLARAPRVEPVAPTATVISHELVAADVARIDRLAGQVDSLHRSVQGLILLVSSMAPRRSAS